MRFSTRKLALAAALAACCGGLAQAALASEPARNLRFEGDWVRTDTNGSGDFSDLGVGYQQARLTPAGAAALQAARRAFEARLHPLRGGPHQAGQAYQVVQTPCRVAPSDEGALGINPDSAAIHIVISRDQFVIAPERGGIRIIYVDGRPHPPAALWAPRAGGNGVGHFEGNDFVADTIGMSAGQVPAGGWRTPQTHLAERYTLSADGNKLTIHYTWTDPKVYVQPHSYIYTFDRLPPGSYAFEDWCDPSDPSAYTSIVPPSQTNKK
jgi:hypothetical protein